MSDRCSSCSSRESCSSSDDCSTCGQSDRLPPGMLSEYDITNDAADGVMIWIETDLEGNMIGSVPETIGVSKELDQGRLFGVIFGDVSRKGSYSILFEYGIDTLYHVRSKDLNEFHSEAYASATADIAKKVRPSVILASATPNGNDLMQRTASILGTESVSDCVQLKIVNERLIMTSYSEDNELTEISHDTNPQIATIRPGTFEKAIRETGRKGSVMNIPFTGHIKN